MSALLLRRARVNGRRVDIALRDGRVLTDETRATHGDAANPPTREELVRKFTTLAVPVLGSTRAAEVVNAVARLDAVDDIRTVTALLATGR